MPCHEALISGCKEKSPTVGPRTLPKRVTSSYSGHLHIDTAPGRHAAQTVGKLLISYDQPRHDRIRQAVWFSGNTGGLRELANYNLAS